MAIHLTLIITEKATELFDHKVDEMLSDHHVLLMYIDMTKPHHPVKYITHRKLRNLNMNQIKSDIMEFNKKLNEITDLNEQVSLYNNGLK